MIIEKLTKNFEDKKRFFLYIFITITITFGLFCYVTYNLSKSNFYDSVDKILKNSAYSINFLLKDDFHDRAIDAESITEKEDKININHLTNYAKFSEIEYLYTMVKKDGKIYFTSSSATDEDFEKELVTKYFDEYESATTELMNAFESDNIIFEESTDKWGTFRSVFIPMTSKDGNKYVLGADIDINYIQHSLHKILINYVILFIVSMLIVYALYTRKTNLELEEMENIQVIQDELKEEIKLKTLELKNLNDNLEQKIKKEVKKNLEQEKILLKNSKYAAMGEMIDAVAHQWKQPLNVINIELGTVLKAIEYQVAQEEDIVSSIQVSTKQIEHLNTTINQFRQFFNPRQVKKSVNLENVVNNSLSLLNPVIKQNGINITVNCEDEINCELVESEFIHVFINLVNNSIDAFLDNKIKDKYIDIGISRINEKAIIKFQDNAGGIPTDIINKIFKANFTTKDEGKGSGVGLYLTSMIIQKLDGEIEAKNILTHNGNGVLFTITI